MDPSIDPAVGPSVDPTIDPAVDPALDPAADPAANLTADLAVCPATDLAAGLTADPSADTTTDKTLNHAADVYYSYDVHGYGNTTLALYPSLTKVPSSAHGMLGFQSSGQNRGPGGNTSGNQYGSQNPDPYASIWLTGQVHPNNNSNNHNNFGRNPYRLEGIKDFGIIPILGDQAMWSEWKLMIDGLILCQTWAWKLFDVPCPFMAWHIAKMFLAKSLSKSDKHIVFRSENWLQAMHNLKQVHAPDDDNSVDAITEKMITARLGDREAASTLINRMMELNATLSTLGRPFEEAHLVSMIKKAIN
jgi:hypothetical protein